MTMDLTEYLRRQKTWSWNTFGPSARRLGIVAHIRKELDELAAAQTRDDMLGEWVDIVILALDGAWRTGFTADEICAALWRKQEINFARQWPPPGPEDQPTEHVR